MSQALATSRLTQKERSAIQDLIGSETLGQLRNTRLQSTADKRKEVRARLQALPALEEALTRYAAARASIEPKILKAHAALNALLLDAESMRIETKSVEFSRDRLQYTVSQDLWELADARAHGMRYWLSVMRGVARNSWKSDSMMERKLRGVVMKVVSNNEHVAAAVAAVDQASAALEQLVLRSDALDFGPELERIKASVLQAFKPLDGLHVQGHDFPELDLD